MNVHESERLAVMLEHAGFLQLPHDSHDSPDIIIFNTCCIRNTAEQKILTHISQAKKLKKSNPNLVIAVIGCLSAHKEIAGVDIALGTNELDKLMEFLTPKHTQKNFGTGNSIIITHGCENFCSYCIVPYVRGKEYSRDIAEIEHEFAQILAKKVQKSAQKRTKNTQKCNEKPQKCNEKPQKNVIFLLGQNVNSYKCPRTGATFVDLLDKLCAHNGDFQINFMSSHPKDFSTELIDCIARNEKIERNIHLPLQSGCNKILALMNRNYTVEQYTQKIELLRAKIPNIHITTDIICGFPNETEQDFAQTVETMKKLRFDAAFIFPYSRRSGTAADTMPNQLDTATKRARATELIKLQREISHKF